MSGINNRNRGKNTERNIAKYMNGKRLGVLGGVDVETDMFSIEVKDRVKSAPHGWMEQAVRHMGDKIPMLIIHKHGSRHDNDLICFRKSDYMDLYDPAEIEKC